MMAPDFRTQYDRKVVKTHAGSPEKTVFESHFDRHGTLILEATGKINTDDIIQSHKSSTDLSMLVARYNNGDVTALNRVQGIYADMSQAPHSLQEALSIIDRSKSDFDSLPLDIRSKFDNNFARFVSELGTQDWFEKMNMPQASPLAKDAVASEVIADE